jgi:ketosteroid isomerase-like protein
MNRSDVQAWLDRYIAAWRSHDPGEIGALFTDDAVYRYRPYGGDKTADRGREAIIRSWLEDDDPPDRWEASYEPFAVDGDRAVAVGYSRYNARGDEPEKTYQNAFLLRFADDGRCAEFTEFYMLEEPPSES